MNWKSRKRSGVDYVFAAVASFGFLLMLTERNGGAWAGTFIGAAALAVGAFVFLGRRIIY